jgi:hypothetical protein
MANNQRGDSNQNGEFLYSLVKVPIFLVGFALFIWGLFALAPIWRWVLVAAAGVGILLWAGKRGTTWGWLGALVDPQRGKYSLGQLQLVLWTLLIVSAWVAIVATRIALRVPDGSEAEQLVTEITESYQQVEEALIGNEARDQLDELVALKTGLPTSEQMEEDKERIAELEAVLGSQLQGDNGGLLDRIADREQELRALLEADVAFADALNVEIPPEILALLGISAASLVGGAVIKNDKGPIGEEQRGKKPTLDNSNVQRHYSYLLAAGKGDAEAEVRLSWLDIFKGDQDGDKNYIDIGKFQMFWFTGAALLTYGMQIAAMLDMATGNEVLQAAGLTSYQVSRLGFALTTSLPAVSASLAGILAISHGAYLANKVPTRPEPEVGGAGGSPQAKEKIKIVSLKVGTVDAANVFTEASGSIPPGPVAVQVEPQSYVSNAKTTAATIEVELRSTAPGDAIPITIDMGGKSTWHNVSAVALTAGDWQAVVVKALDDEYDGLHPDSAKLVKGFTVA